MRKPITKFMPISFFTHLVFEVFQEREFKEMLAVYYLFLHACISFLKSVRHKWRTSVFALFAYKCRSHISINLCSGEGPVEPPDNWTVDGTKSLGDTSSEPVK